MEYLARKSGTRVVTRMKLIPETGPENVQAETNDDDINIPDLVNFLSLKNVFMFKLIFMVFSLLNSNQFAQIKAHEYASKNFGVKHFRHVTNLGKMDRFSRCWTISQQRVLLMAI